MNGKLFKRGESVALGASGGKDSTVLASVLKDLNERYDYGLKLILLSIDEGITGNSHSNANFMVQIIFQELTYLYLQLNKP